MPIPSAVYPLTQRSAPTGRAIPMGAKPGEFEAPGDLRREQSRLRSRPAARVSPQPKGTPKMASAAPTHAPTYTVGGISLTRAEARDLTDRINNTAGELCLLLVEAHDREAWRALGYASWREYAEQELNISRSYAYRQVDQGRVTLALLSAIAMDADVSPNGDTQALGMNVTEAVARDVKPHLPEVVEEVKARVQSGEPAAEVVPEVIKSAREITQATRPAKPEPEPEPDTSPDLLAELEEADKRIKQLEAENASLRADDTGTEIRKLHAQLAQLNANHQGVLQTQAELRRQAEYGEKQLRRIRSALGVERDRDIFGAIAALKGE